MAGFRKFQTGEVLTAANVNDFLMEQSVMKFADSSARDAALGTAVAGGNALREGMVAYLDDTDELLKYDGSSWVGVGGAGGLVAVKHVLKTDTEEELNVSPGDSFAVPDLSITHEVADASNRLIISAFFGSAGTSSGFGQVGIAVHDGSSLIAVGDADGDRTRVTAGGQISPSISAGVVTMPSVTFVHTPGAGSKTYTVHAINIRVGTQTLYINRAQSNTNNANHSRAVSSLVIQEVSV